MTAKSFEYNIYFLFLIYAESLLQAANIKKNAKKAATPQILKGWISPSLKKEAASACVLYPRTYLTYSVGTATSRRGKWWVSIDRKG